MSVSSRVSASRGLDLPLCLLWSGLLLTLSVGYSR